MKAGTECCYTLDLRAAAVRQGIGDRRRMKDSDPFVGDSSEDPGRARRRQVLLTSMVVPSLRRVVEDRIDCNFQNRFIAARGPTLVIDRVAPPEADGRFGLFVGYPVNLDLD